MNELLKTAKTIIQTNFLKSLFKSVSVVYTLMLWRFYSRGSLILSVSFITEAEITWSRLSADSNLSLFTEKFSALSFLPSTKSEMFWYASFQENSNDIGTIKKK